MDEEEVLQIKGGTPLCGSIAADGSKNASLPILAATVLSNDEVELVNLPNIRDVAICRHILEAIGATVREEDNSIRVKFARRIDPYVPRALGSKIRGSYYYLGALLGRTGRAEIPHPGGCDIGVRAMDLHVAVLQELDCAFTERQGTLYAESRTSLKNHSRCIRLPFPSRGATINLILFSAARAGFELTIVNANESPECLALQDFLLSLGVEVERPERGTVVVRGREPLRPTGSPSFAIPPDKVEAATLLIAGVVTAGSVVVSNAEISPMIPFLSILEEMGVEHVYGSLGLALQRGGSSLRSVDVISTLQPDGLDADFEPILAALLCGCSGSAIIEDAINPERHSRFLPYLIAAGADISVHTPTRAAIRGPTRFRPFVGIAGDIRGGASQLLAAVAAEGDSLLYNPSQIDRGYSRLDLKLERLGASIVRTPKLNFGM